MKRFFYAVAAFAVVASFSLAFTSCETEPINNPGDDKEWYETAFPVDIVESLWPYEKDQTLVFVNDDGESLTMTVDDISVYYQPLGTKTPDEQYSNNYEWFIMQGRLYDGISSAQPDRTLLFYVQIVDRRLASIETDITKISSMEGTVGYSFIEEDEDDHQSLFNTIKSINCDDKKGNTLAHYTTEKGLIYFVDGSGVTWTLKE